jgi:hypothetical protein
MTGEIRYGVTPTAPLQSGNQEPGIFAVAAAPKGGHIKVAATRPTILNARVARTKTRQRCPRRCYMNRPVPFRVCYSKLSDSVRPSRPRLVAGKIVVARSRWV